MTTVVAAETKKKIIFATDSQVTFGARKERMPKGKIVKNGDIVFAFAGAVRVKNILEHANLPKTPSSRKWDAIEQWAVKKLVPSMRKALREEEAIEIRDGEANSSSSILVAVNGRLFEVSSDFAVTRNDEGVYSIGSGSSYALGALAAGASPVQAVGIATYFDSYSGGDIHELVLKAEKAKNDTH